LAFESNLLCKIIGFIHLINNQLYKKPSESTIEVKAEEVK